MKSGRYVYDVVITSSTVSNRSLEGSVSVFEGNTLNGKTRFGDQSVPRVTRVATGGGGGTIGGMSDVDLTDTSQGGLAEGSVLVYDSAATRFVATNVLNNITVNGGSF